jgi:cation:H+ antiporter
MIELFTQNPLLFHLLIALTSLIIVAKSADFVVYGISHYAKKLGISDYLVGFLVVSIGTAIPELIASLTGAMIGQGDIVFGTVFGSNLFKIPLLGITILIAKKIKIKQNMGMNAPIVTLFISIFPLFLIIDGILSKTEGIFLLLLFIIYIARLWHGEGELGRMKKSIRIKDVWKDALIFTLALGALLLASRFLVFSSISLSEILNISPYFVGLIIIGIGASTPELTVQIRSILKHHQNIAFGNVLGSLVANSALVLGLVALIKPVYIQPSTLIVTAIFMVTGTIYALLIMEKETVTRKQGLMLIGFYLLFLLTEFLMQFVKL